MCETDLSQPSVVVGLHRQSQPSLRWLGAVILPLQGFFFCQRTLIFDCYLPALLWLPRLAYGLANQRRCKCALVFDHDERDSRAAQAAEVMHTRVRAYIRRLCMDREREGRKVTDKLLHTWFYP